MTDSVSDIQILSSLTMLTEVLAAITGQFSLKRPAESVAGINAFKDEFRRWTSGEIDGYGAHFESVRDAVFDLELMIALQFLKLDPDGKKVADFLIARALLNLSTVEETHGMISNTCKTLMLKEPGKHLQNLKTQAEALWLK
jgi:hypothetical protein